MSHAFQISPREVLGVSEDASLSELHEAYRSKSKKYHPDVGGDEWAFRILSRSYELLSAARVMSRADEEMRREESAQAAEARRRAAEANPFARVQPRREGSSEGQSRTGVRDQVSDPLGLVPVEMLLLRYELDGPLGLFLGGKPEERNLSCTLSIEWPDGDARGLGDARVATRVQQAIQAAFRAACKAVPPASASSRAESQRFVGLISYASALQADEALKVFRKSLQAKGFGVAQTIREVTIPRDWQG